MVRLPRKLSQIESKTDTDTQPVPDHSKPDQRKKRSSTAVGKKDASGLGRALINRRTKEHRRIYEEALHTTELPSGLHSVTQENDLDEFLNTAQLAATDFTAGMLLTSVGSDLKQQRLIQCHTQNDRISKCCPARQWYSRTHTCSPKQKRSRSKRSTRTTVSVYEYHVDQDGRVLLQKKISSVEKEMIS